LNVRIYRCGSKSNDRVLFERTG
jgi:Protein of unknown function (DUF3754)